VVDPAGGDHDHVRRAVAGLLEADQRLAGQRLDRLRAAEDRPPERLPGIRGLGEAVEDRLETLRQGFEHWILSESRGGIAKST